MDASKDLPQASSPAGELVVQGGRMDGTRRALGDPLTLLGSSSGCDIRLNVDSIAPIQCAIVIDVAGAVLRDLAGSLTHVNGQPVKMRRLVDGDVIDLGPFRFRLALRAPGTAEVDNSAIVASNEDLEGLRIQAAAVAAQQAQMVEAESKLEARAVSLEKQEAQLAAHLESRQKELDASQERLRQAVETQAAEHAAERAARADLERQQSEWSARRKKLSQLRRRLFARSKKQTAQASADARRREAEATAAKARHEREQERLLAWQEKANTDNELQKRQLKEEWQELGLDQQRWEAALNEEKADRARREKEQAAQAAELLSAREAMSADRAMAQQELDRLLQETAGLQSRIAAQRGQLEKLERQVAGLRQATAPTSDVIPPSPAPATDMEQWPERLRLVAGWLGDQRMHLLEQWQQFLQVQHSWEEEREAALAELEAAARSADEREKAVIHGERSLAGKQAEQVRRQQALDTQRIGLEGWHTRLASQEHIAQQEREQATSRAEAREQLAELRRRQYEMVHQRRNERRRLETQHMQDALRRIEEAHRLYESLRQETDRARQSVEQAESALAGQAQALERGRLELVGDSAQTARLLDRMQKEEAARQEQASRGIEAERSRLAVERQWQDGQILVLVKREAELAARSQSQHREAEAWEAARLAADAEEQRRQHEARQLRAQQAAAEREARQLREELERLARTLMEEGGVEEQARSTSAAA